MILPKTAKSARRSNKKGANSVEKEKVHLRDDLVKDQQFWLDEAKEKAA